jgi:ribosomal protein S10
MNATISIVLKSFDIPKCLIQSKTKNQDNSKSCSLHKDKKLESEILHSIRLPNDITKYTVLRSPHIDKKSREQFQMKVHKQFLTFYTDIYSLHKDLLNLKLHNVSGIQLKVIVNYKTRLPFLKKKS